MREQAEGVARGYRLAERASFVAGVLILILAVVLDGFLGLSHAVFVVCLFAGSLLVVGTGAIHGLGLQAEVRERVRREGMEEGYEPE